MIKRTIAILFHFPVIMVLSMMNPEHQENAIYWIEVIAIISLVVLLLTMLYEPFSEFYSVIKTSSMKHKARVENTKKELEEKYGEEEERPYTQEEIEEMGLLNADYNNYDPITEESEDSV